MVICTVFYLSIGEHWTEYVFAHIGGVSMIGLLGWCAGFISKNKGHGFWKAFFLGTSLPLFLGVVAVLILEGATCGGSVSLAVAILMIAIYSLFRRTNEVGTINP